MSDLVRVRFLEERTLLDADGQIDQCFEAGQEYDLRPDQAQRWVRRRAAVEVPPKKAKPSGSAPKAADEPSESAPEPSEPAAKAEKAADKPA